MYVTVLCDIFPLFQTPLISKPGWEPARIWLLSETLASFLARCPDVAKEERDCRAMQRWRTLLCYPWCRRSAPSWRLQGALLVMWREAEQLYGVPEHALYSLPVEGTARSLVTWAGEARATYRQEGELSVLDGGVRGHTL